ncbi:MAG TPA: VOC family protein [Streptosporangiaceae bacterium]|jgi:predicted enzyme related to lactoylglutathione lyase
MSVNLLAVTFDCADAANLAAFWGQVLEHPVDEGGTEEFAAIGLAGSAATRPCWMFLKVPEGKTAKNRVHPDLGAASLEAEVKRLVDLGATKQAEQDQDGVRWVTFLDPEGNEFDVVADPS